MREIYSQSQIKNNLQYNIIHKSFNFIEKIKIIQKYPKYTPQLVNFIIKKKNMIKHLNILITAYKLN